MKTKKKVKKLSKTSEKLLDEFDICAVNQGVTGSWPPNEHTDETKSRYILARENLRKHLLELESK